jgi:hypothetical protein
MAIILDADVIIRGDKGVFDLGAGRHRVRAEATVGDHLLQALQEPDSCD